MESRVSSETAIAMGAESLCQDLFLALPQSTGYHWVSHIPDPGCGEPLGKVLA